jgi:hypothetical protein
MKPVILTDPDDSSLSWIVDEHSTSVLVSPLTHDHLIHYETAIEIADLRPGEIRWHDPFFNGLLGVQRIAHYDEAMAQFTKPSPCVYAQVNTHKRQVFDGPAGMDCIKGIYRPAAVVMLQLTASKNNVKTDGVKRSFTFNDPRIEDVPVPWNEWKFLTAWLWSDWKTREISTQKRITQNQRWEEMRAIGYPHGFKAFEAMHRSLFGNLRTEIPVDRKRRK